MNAQSRSPALPSPTSPARSPKPRRPLPALPIYGDAPAPEPETPPVWPDTLVMDDPKRPFQLLEAPPLSLLCSFHNVKRVSLEDGVPPPFRFDVPIVTDRIDNPDALLPTHMLAVYDQDNSPDVTSPTSVQPLSPSNFLLPPQPSTPGTKPDNPIMIPVNANIWSRCFTKPIGTSSVPPASSARSSPITARGTASPTIPSGRPTSMYGGRPPSRAILTLPVHILRVPSAQSLPLLLLASFNVLPYNCVAPLLLPRYVLTELPSPPLVLAQRLLRWLYPERSKRLTATAGTASSSSQPHSSGRPRQGSRAHEHRPSPSTSSASTSTSSALGHSKAPSSHSHSQSQAPSSPSSSSHPQPITSPSSEPICVLSDPATASDPDLRLIYLAQQNFGLWANALALGVKDAEVTQLVELGWSVAAEARRLRFGDVVKERERGGRSGDERDGRRARSRAPSSASGTQRR